MLCCLDAFGEMWAQYTVRNGCCSTAPSFQGHIKVKNTVCLLKEGGMHILKNTQQVLDKLDY